MTVFLRVEQVREINAQTGNVVRDQGTVASAVMRCQASAGGSDAFPTLHQKAAALLHGLASTQGFSDGNKRTAWIATKTFLALNGSFMRKMPDIAAEVFVLAVSASLLDLDKLSSG